MRVVFNADDFGRSPSINTAVIRAHREGVLTSASLMVTGDAAEEAVALARATPTLAVGLHLVLAGGRPALPPARVPHLVDAGGHFPGNPAVAGLRYFLSRAARKELASEVRAQFKLFADTGLRLSHVDGHMNLHLHPVVLPLVLAAAAEYGAKGFRLPRDDLWLSLRHDRRLAGTKVVWAVAFALLCRHARKVAKLLVPGLPVVADRVFGLMESGWMGEGYVLKVLDRLERLDRLAAPGGPVTAELYFHPDTAPQVEPLGPNPGDLAALLSPTVRQAIEERGLCLTTYLDLERGVN